MPDKRLLWKIEAIIRPFKLDDVKEALLKKVLRGMTITEMREYGRQKGHKETYRGSEYQIEFVPKIKMKLLLMIQWQKNCWTILRTAKTGQVGDGKIFYFQYRRCNSNQNGWIGPSANYLLTKRRMTV